MAKILVSDLFGTLVPINIQDMEFLYSSGQRLRTREEIWANSKYYNELLDRVFLQLAKNLEPYLSEGNYFYLVTASDSHDGSGFLFDEIISRFCKYTWKYRDQVSVFLSGVLDCEREFKDLSTVARIEEKDGVMFADNEEGSRAILLNSKDEVFNFVEKRQNLCTGQLFAIGDDIKDLPMLFRCIELGGKSSVIWQDLYREKKTSQEILHETAIRNSNLMLGTDNIPYSDPRRGSFGERRQVLYRQEWDRLYGELGEGVLDLDDLEKNEYIYSMLNTYNDFSSQFHEWPRVKVSDKTIDSFGMFPTFASYRDKVLVYKK